jgi:N,N-dimethylformamidase beta subunit-like protein
MMDSLNRWWRTSVGRRIEVCARLTISFGWCLGGCAHAPPPNTKAEPSSGGASIIVVENSKPGTRDWMLADMSAAPIDESDAKFQRVRAIEGYVSHTSIRPGEALTAYVSVDPPQPYRVDVFRMGYYGGAGGRRVATFGPFVGAQQSEPTEGPRHLVEAGWRPSFEVPIADDWVSGVYLAKMTTTESGQQSYLVWVVRDDRHADLAFKVSDLTWQAYNRWPAWRSLYDWEGDRWSGASRPRVSFDRPYGAYYNPRIMPVASKTKGSGEFLLWEFPLAYWLESRGYDVTYISSLDVHEHADELLRARGLLVVGHDEYWTRQMFDGVTRARDAGLSIAFMSGNLIDTPIELMPSSTQQPDRTFNRVEDMHRWYPEFEDEQTLTGAAAGELGSADWIVRQPEHWLFAGTSMQAGDSIRGLVGWEFNKRPLREDPSLVVVASGPLRKFEDSSPLGNDFVATAYDTASGGAVVNLATNWWSMVLASPPGCVSPLAVELCHPDPRVESITENLMQHIINR